jgi:hypothetical protein
VRFYEILLLGAVNGVIALYYLRAYQQGMPLARLVPLALVTFIAVNLASLAGRLLGERRARRRRTTR